MTASMYEEDTVIASPKEYGIQRGGTEEGDERGGRGGGYGDREVVPGKWGKEREKGG